MHKEFNIIVIIGLMFIFQGCVSLKVQEKLRVDQGMDGNSGYLVGEVKSENNVQNKLTRKCVSLAVDSPRLCSPRGIVKKADKWVKKNLW